MSGNNKIPAADVMPFALELRRHLLTVCEKVVIAGSLRRGKTFAGDVEMVLLPRWDPLQDTASSKKPPVPTCAALDSLLAGLSSMITLDTVVKRNGPRYKRFVALPSAFPLPDNNALHGPSLPCGPRLPVDLFLADHHNFGNLLAIRTGDADFAKLLVTHVSAGGLMPDNRRQFGGYLHDRPMHLPDYVKVLDVDLATDSVVSCRTEKDFFAALGLDYLAPAERDRSGVEIIRL